MDFELRGPALPGRARSEILAGRLPLERIRAREGEERTIDGR